MATSLICGSSTLPNSDTGRMQFLVVLVSDGENSPIIHSNIHIEGNPWRCALFADGACPGNGTPLARASFGVYGKPDAWYNQRCLLPSTILQTNQSAEIESAIAALYVARAIIKNRWAGMPRPRHVVTAVLIVMDSCYVKVMTEWIRKWRVNGFRNSRGQPVVNMEALQFLDAEVRRLFEDHLVIVQFWLVPRIHNSGADRMAGEALRGNSSWKPMDSDLDSDLDNLTEKGLPVNGSESCMEFTCGNQGLQSQNTTIDTRSLQSKRRYGGLLVNCSTFLFSSLQWRCVLVCALQL